jgi:hypothetical protein
MFRLLSMLHTPSELITYVRPPLPSTQSFMLGAIATMIASSLTFPAARARAILQTQRLSEAGGKLRARDVLRTIIHSEGWAGLYKGLGPQLVKGVLSSALMLATKEKLHKYAAVFVRLMIMVLQLSLANSRQHVLRLRAPRPAQK